MAQRVNTKAKELIVDRILLVALLAIAMSYIMRGSWSAPFFEAGAIVLGVIWSMRAIMTNPRRTFRLMAALVLVLIWCLLSFYLWDVHDLI